MELPNPKTRNYCGYVDAFLFKIPTQNPTHKNKNSDYVSGRKSSALTNTVQLEIYNAPLALYKKFCTRQS